MFLLVPARTFMDKLRTDLRCYSYKQLVKMWASLCEMYVIQSFNAKNIIIIVVLTMLMPFNHIITD